MDNLHKNKRDNFLTFDEPDELIPYWVKDSIKNPWSEVEPSRSIHTRHQMRGVKWGGLVQDYLQSH